MTIDVSLHIAARNGELDRVKQFIEDGADIFSTDQHGNTPLHQAADFGNVNVVEFLIMKGADFLAKNHEGQQPIDLACGEEAKELLRKAMQNVMQVINVRSPNIPSHFFTTTDKKAVLGILLIVADLPEADISITSLKAEDSTAGGSTVSSAQGIKP